MSYPVHTVLIIYPMESAIHLVDNTQARTINDCYMNLQ